MGLLAPLTTGCTNPHSCTPAATDSPHPPFAFWIISEINFNFRALVHNSFIPEQFTAALLSTLVGPVSITPVCPAQQASTFQKWQGLSCNFILQPRFPWPRVQRPYELFRTPNRPRLPVTCISRSANPFHCLSSPTFFRFRVLSSLFRSCDSSSCRFLSLHLSKCVLLESLNALPLGEPGLLTLSPR